MGCMCSSTPLADANGQAEKQEKKRLSWDKKEVTSKTEYTIENLCNETIYRHPGTLDGQPLNIQNCKDCVLYVFDNVASATVVDCVNCKIFIGPVKGSAILRNCNDCAIIVASMRFRASNCHKMDVYLCSSTKPTIEHSSGMRFGCYQYYYPALEEQFNRAQLSVYNNCWADIVDSTPVSDDCNFSLIPSDVNVDDIVPYHECCKELEVTTDKISSIVPPTPADKMAPFDTLCVVMFFSDGLSHDRARVFIQQMETNHPECRLMQCREQAMEDDQSLTVFGTDKYSVAVKQGAVIALVYSGADSCSLCQKTLVGVSCGSTGLVAISANSDIATHQVNAFFGTDVPRLAPSSSIRLRRS